MADSKISALTAATTLNDADILYLVQSATDKKISYATLKTLLNAAIFVDGSVSYAKLSTAVKNLILTENQNILMWAESKAFEMTSITRDEYGLISSASVVWPDGSTGTYTAGNFNDDYYAYDSFTITHTDSGQTVTQAAVTRDTGGNVTTKPQLTIS